MITADTITERALFVALMDHISASQAYARARSLRDSGVVVDLQCWVLVNLKTGAIRIEDAGAWVDEDEENYTLFYDPNTRGHDVETFAAATAVEILNARNEGK